MISRKAVLMWLLASALVVWLMVILDMIATHPVAAALIVAVSMLGGLFVVLFARLARKNTANWTMHLSRSTTQHGRPDIRQAHLTQRYAQTMQMGPSDLNGGDLMRPILLDLTTKRLQDRYGLDFEADADEIERLLGPDVYAYLAGHVLLQRARRDKQLAHIISRIEVLT